MPKRKESLWNKFTQKLYLDNPEKKFSDILKMASKMKKSGVNMVDYVNNKTRKVDDKVLKAVSKGKGKGKGKGKSKGKSKGKGKGKGKGKSEKKIKKSKKSNNKTKKKGGKACSFMKGGDSCSSNKL